MAKKTAKRKASRKKTAKRKTSPRLDPNAVEIAVELLLLHNSLHRVQEELAAGLGKTPASVQPLIDEARRRLALAAGFDKVEELGRAVKRLNSLYQHSITGKNWQTALASQKELNRLLSLGSNSGPSASTPDGDDPPGNHDEVAAYLRPAIDPGGSLPVEELARLAANEIAELRAARA